MNLGQFHSRVSQAIKRGTSLDAIIPLWVAEAARVLEQNYAFSWMGRTTSITIPQSAGQLQYAMSALIRNIEWVKPLLAQNGDGTEWYGDTLIGVDSRDVTGISGGNPQGYWLEGTDGAYVLKFDTAAQREYKAKINWNQFTDWPVDDAATPTLLLRGQLALFSQTLILFANEQRDERMAGTYGGILQGALNTLLRSEEDLKGAHQNDLKMGYSGLE